jgi:hypothetical protein
MKHDKNKQKEYQKKWEAENPGMKALFAKQWREKYPEKAKLSKKKWRQNNPIKVSLLKQKHKLLKYGITIENYNEMLINQNNVCIICLRPETMTRGNKLQSFSVDHCHKTGKVRGLLCSKCNTAIGLFDDNPILVRSAMMYLLKFDSKSESKELKNEAR